MRTGRTRRLACESLESRLCMAGNVLATVTNGVLYVKGDAESNDVEIQQLAPTGSQDPWPGYRYQIIGRNTTINDEPLQGQGRVQFSIITVEGVKNGAHIFLAAGNDTLRVTRPGVGRANVPGKVDIIMGDGGDIAILWLQNHQQVNIQMGGDDDLLRMNRCIVNALTIDTDWTPSPPAGARKAYADGFDQVEASFLTANGAVSINTGGKTDWVTLGVSKISSSLSVDTGAGNDRCGIGEEVSGAFTAQSSVTVRTSGGNDVVGIGMGAGSILIDAGAGDDEVELIAESTTVVTSLTVWLGAGNDSLTMKLSKGLSARLDGGLGTDSISGLSDANFESLVVTNFES